MFKRDTRAALYRPHLDDKLTVISFMTLAELDRWVLEHQWGEKRQHQLQEFLQDFVFAYCDRDLCRKWAEAITSARRKGYPIEIADAWVAATALLYSIPLVTHNRNHYVGVDGLSVISEAP
jgi:predicted nucleic acid-binding protein